MRNEPLARAHPPTRALARLDPGLGRAICRAEAVSRDEANSGAVAFSRRGNPDGGKFDDAVVLKTFGDVPDDFGCA